jgi:uncharacterized repeat protein (TIGR03847 family)
MAGRVYNFEQPDRFIAGTIGQPGSRTFYLQAREGTRIVSVLLEKVQVSLLAERLTELLSEIRERGGDVPDEPSPADVDAAPLDEPLNELFRVGTMAIIWNGEEQTILVEAREIGEEAGEEAESAAEIAAETAAEIVAEIAAEDPDADVVRVQLKPKQALAFAQRALEVVASGRPPCPFCGQPLNPEGHICARRNGFMH